VQVAVATLAVAMAAVMAETTRCKQRVLSVRTLRTLIPTFTGAKKFPSILTYETTFTGGKKYFQT
jgi:hypothetical protein